MADQGYITETQAASAKAAPLVTLPNAGYSAYSPWFVDVVRIQAQRAGIPVTRGGYRIYTGLDPILQNAATQAQASGGYTLTVKDFTTENKPDWCPGCGDFGILNAIKKALVDLGKQPHEVTVIAGIVTEFVGWLTLTHTQRWHAHYHSAGTGHLYQGRFKSFPVQEDDHYFTVCRYVERNPLRANLVKRAEDWQWSSP